MAVGRENHDALYTIFKIPGYLSRCFYCGAQADTLDHVPPVSRVSDYQALGLEREQYWKVPCCRECNSLLSDSLQETLIEREAYLKWTLEKRYWKKIDMPYWRKSEINKLGRMMKSYIKKCMREKKEIEERLEYGVGINTFISRLEITDPYQEALDEKDKKDN